MPTKRIEDALNRRRRDFQSLALPLSYPAMMLVMVAIVFSAAKNVHAEIDLNVIAQIESSGNAAAVGDGGKALGKFQLHQDVVVEYNRFHNTRYSHRIALDSTISSKIAHWYLHKRIPQMLRHFKKPVTTENVLIAYNAGILNAVRGRIPTTTKKYLTKYHNLARTK